MSNMQKAPIHQQIRSLRQDLGLTQFQLAAQAEVSLPSIQKIESGKANPALNTLQSIFAVLGLELSARSRAPDWNILIACGAPLMEKPVSNQRILPTKRLLVTELIMACKYLQETEDPRKKEILQALLLALKHHYPTLFKTWLLPVKEVSVSCLKDDEITGRIIKLRRIALAVLGTYL